MTQDIRAITFDLFDTLIYLKKSAFDEALIHLVKLTREQGFDVPDLAFRRAYRAAAKKAFAEGSDDGKERHNSLWLADSLEQFGYSLPATDQRIERIISDYFAEFVKYVAVLPGVREALSTLSQKYRLALLSNFTHGPAAREILEIFELGQYFEVIVISGEAGFRKPHPRIFEILLQQLRMEPNTVAYIGDNWIDDMTGARDAGMIPVWTHIATSFRASKSDQVLPKFRAEPDFEVLEIHRWEELIAVFE